MKKLIIAILISILPGCIVSFQPIEQYPHMDKPKEFVVKELHIMLHPINKGLMRPPIGGRAYCEGTRIIVEGYMHNGKIVVYDRKALGHEVANILHCLYPNLVFNHEKLPE